MTKKAFAWLGMTLLAFAVAGYAITLLFAPELRPAFVRTLVVERPFTAFAHFAGGAIALVAGTFQLNSRLRTSFIGAHRWLGRLYLLAVVSGGAAGFALAQHAFGGLTARAGFGLLAVCWTGSTLNAYRNIRQGNLSAHRSWMIRSYALTLAAVTLRVYLPLEPTGRHSDASGLSCNCMALLGSQPADRRMVRPVPTLFRDVTCQLIQAEAAARLGTKGLVLRRGEVIQGQIALQHATQYQLRFSRHQRPFASHSRLSREA